MGIAHKAVGSHSCTFSVWDGDIDEEEVRAHLVRLAEDPDWPPGAFNLADLTTMGNVSIPDLELVAILQEGTTLETELKTALVVRPELIEADARQYADVARATRVTAFTDLRSASKHLGIPPEISQSLMDALRQSL